MLISQTFYPNANSWILVLAATFFPKHWSNVSSEQKSKRPRDISRGRSWSSCLWKSHCEAGVRCLSRFLFFIISTVFCLLAWCEWTPFYWSLLKGASMFLFIKHLCFCVTSMWNSQYNINCIYTSRKLVNFNFLLKLTCLFSVFACLSMEQLQCRPHQVEEVKCSLIWPIDLKKNLMCLWHIRHFHRNKATTLTLREMSCMM